MSAVFPVPAGGADGESLWQDARREAEKWLLDFRESANPQTAEERWDYLDQAAVHIEKLVNHGEMFDA